MVKDTQTFAPIFIYPPIQDMLMKIYAFTDIHAEESQLNKNIQKIKKEKPELVILTGDISVFNNGLEMVLSKLDKLKIPVITIHGNHEDYNIFKDICSKFKNIVNLHKKFYRKDNFIFWGFGGGGFAITDKEFEKAAKEFADVIKDNKDKKTILLIHGPPDKCKLDVLPRLGHVGCKSRYNFIKKNQPTYVFCGHLHENEGKKDKIGKTTLYNCGWEGKFLEI